MVLYYNITTRSKVNELSSILFIKLMSTLALVHQPVGVFQFGGGSVVYVHTCARWVATDAMPCDVYMCEPTLICAAEEIESLY